MTVKEKMKEKKRESLEPSVDLREHGLATAVPFSLLSLSRLPSITFSFRLIIFLSADPSLSLSYLSDRDLESLTNVGFNVALNNKKKKKKHVWMEELADQAQVSGPTLNPQILLSTESLTERVNFLLPTALQGCVTQSQDAQWSPCRILQSPVQCKAFLFTGRQRERHLCPWQGWRSESRIEMEWLWVLTNSPSSED